MSIPIIILTAFSCIISVVAPWLGVVIYYAVGVGQPSAFYPHHFGESRLSLYLTLATLVGLGIATAARKVDWSRLFLLPNLLLMLLVLLFNLSVYHSPFAEFVEIKKSALSSLEMLEIFNKIMLFYFVAVLLIDTRFKLVTLLTVLGGVLVLYTAWANKIYFTGEFWRFGDNGRLNGPWGLYHDENYLAMLFVVATPILYYLGVGTRNWIFRYAIWAIIPLTWHALFLTGSRGGLLALGVACCYIFFRSYSKWASIILVLGFAVAVVDQSGLLIDRITKTVSKEDVERDRAYIENTEDSPEIEFEKIDPRVISWQVGIDIMKDFPGLGVGAGNFMRAFPEYDDTEPHVAHNTFIQFGAAAGVAAAVIYIYFLWLRVKNVFTKPNPLKTYRLGLPRDYLDDMVNCLALSFYCVAFFLDLMVIEILYFVLITIVCKYSFDRTKKRSRHSLIDSIYRWRQDSEQFDEPGPGASEEDGAAIAANEMASEEDQAERQEANAPATLYGPEVVLAQNVPNMYANQVTSASK